MQSEETISPRVLAPEPEMKTRRVKNTRDESNSDQKKHHHHLVIHSAGVHNVVHSDEIEEDARTEEVTTTNERDDKQTEFA
jgi:hypothetical protein